MKKKELQHKIKKLAKLAHKVNVLSDELQLELTKRYPYTNYRSYVEEIKKGNGIPEEFVKQFFGEKKFKDDWVYSKQ